MRTLPVVLAACGAAPPPPAPPSAWPVPAGWRSEVLPFPLDFAPSLAHRGVEELRFPPGFFDPASGEWWSYEFAWRLDDPAALAPDTLAVELTTYFRGLVAAVDGDHRVTAPDRIAVAVGFDLAVRAHLVDPFKTAEPIDLVGTAERRACGGGALWVIVLAPATTTIRSQLIDLARDAACGQRPVGKK
jgi:hypothetical protein